MKELKTINKEQLISIISKKKGCTKKEAEEKLTEVCDLLQELLTEGNEIKIFNFASIKPKANSSTVTLSITVGAALKKALTDSLGK